LKTVAVSPSPAQAMIPPCTWRSRC
jgi:hypothetical protein